MIRLDNVVIEVVLVLIALNGPIAFFAAYAGNQMQHRWGGYGLLNEVITGDFLQPFEVFEKRMLPEGNFSRKLQLSSFGFWPFELNRPMCRINMVNILKFLKKVQVPHGTAKFTVGNGFETDFLFFMDKFGNSPVFRRGEFFTRNTTCCKVGARLFEVCRSQETADDIKGKRRCFKIRHGYPSWSQMM